MNNFDIEQYVRNKITPSQLRALTKEQKVQWIKERYGLSHGGGKKNKRRKNKRKRRK